LPGWDVAALSAHTSMLVRMLRHLSAHPVDAEPTVGSARDMLARFNAPGGVATALANVIADAARKDAASMSPADLVAMFAVTAPDVVTAIEDAGPIVVDYFGNGSLPIADAMSIAILEAVVHGLDLTAAVDAAVESIPPAAMEHTVGLLVSLADPVSFIDAASGRTSSPVLPVLR
jgi:hypothetical protein